MRTNIKTEIQNPVNDDEVDDYQIEQQDNDDHNPADIELNAKNDPEIRDFVKNLKGTDLE